MLDRIEIHPDVMLGKPVVRGTRVPVELILRKLSEGAPEADLLDAYPRLTRQDILAALAFAADTIAHEEIVPAGARAATRRGLDDCLAGRRPLPGALLGPAPEP
ncbi:MAG: DUF433 domain-containing protein [Chloroflexi bacterium]|nr:DUF433 domain-containing protein [Chloroflexota bacterium]